MDVCALSTMVFTTLLGCLPNYETICHERDNVKYCQQDFTRPLGACDNKPKQFWECKRPDGTSYMKEFKSE